MIEEIVQKVLNSFVLFITRPRLVANIITAI